MTGIFTQTMTRWRGAVTTLPSLRDCVECVFAIVLFGVVAWWLSQGRSWMGAPAELGLGALLLPFIIPAFLEELVFRGALLPRASEIPIAPWGPAVFALILFVAWHPLNAWLFLPAAQPLFTDPAFLFMAALLGALATLLYMRSQSLWTPVIFHGAIVAGWKIVGAPSFLFAEVR